MISDEIKRETLIYLFDKYINEPEIITHDIKEITDSHAESFRKVGLFLLNRGLVKNPQFTPTGFLCTISMLGIKEVKPQYIIEHTKTIITTIGKVGGEHSVMNVLKLPKNEWRKAKDLAFYLEVLGYLIVNYTTFDAFASLTLFGEVRYEQNENKH